jgi:hypothetical protein
MNTKMANFMGAHGKETKTMENSNYGLMSRVWRARTTPTPCTPMYQTRNRSSMERHLTETITMDADQPHPGGLAPRYNFRSKDMVRP